jgi:hypothetical protein
VRRQSQPAGGSGSQDRAGLREELQAPLASRIILSPRTLCRDISTNQLTRSSIRDATVQTSLCLGASGRSQSLDSVTKRANRVEDIKDQLKVRREISILMIGLEQCRPKFKCPKNLPPCLSRPKSQPTAVRDLALDTERREAPRRELSTASRDHTFEFFACIHRHAFSSQNLRNDATQ